MAGRPHLRERDCRFLELVGRYGYVTMEQAGRFYGTSYYHRHRIRVLEEYGYIARRRGIIQLGALGRELLGMDRTVKINNPQQIKRRLEQVEVGILLENLPVKWEWIPSFAVKEEQPNIFPNFCKLNGLLKSEGEGNVYLVYLLPARPREKTVDKIKLELDRFHRLGYRRAVIFCKSLYAMEQFGYNSFGFEELHLLPYPHGVQLLLFLRHGTVQELGRVLFGGITVGENPQADFTVEVDGMKTDVWFLATNDTARINRLQNYLNIRWQGVTGQRKAAVLCLEPQRERYETLLSGLQVYTFDFDEVMAKLTALGDSWGHFQEPRVSTGT